MERSEQRGMGEKLKFGKLRAETFNREKAEEAQKGLNREILEIRERSQGLRAKCQRGAVAGPVLMGHFLCTAWGRSEGWNPGAGVCELDSLRRRLVTDYLERQFPGHRLTATGRSFH
jgi:hypothetical protein